MWTSEVMRPASVYCSTTASRESARHLPRESAARLQTRALLTTAFQMLLTLVQSTMERRKKEKATSVNILIQVVFVSLHPRHPCHGSIQVVIDRGAC